jgi:hypothetical protein
MALNSLVISGDSPGQNVNIHPGPQPIAFPTHRVSCASILTPASLFHSKLDMHEQNT